MRTLAFIIFFIITSCSNQEANTKSNKFLSEKERISILFKLESKQGTLLTCDEEKSLYNSLPRNFKEYLIFFCNRYKLNDGRKLYLSRTLSFFENSYCLEKEVIIDKLFEWSYNANVTQSCETFSMGSSGVHFDAVINLQEMAQKHFPQNVAACVKVFREKEQNKILSFWRFYFDGPHPESYKEDFKILYHRFAKKDKRVASLMKESYEKLLKNSKCHGH